MGFLLIKCKSDSGSQYYHSGNKKRDHRYKGVNCGVVPLKLDFSYHKMGMWWEKNDKVLEEKRQAKKVSCRAKRLMWEWELKTMENTLELNKFCTSVIPLYCIII